MTLPDFANLPLEQLVATLLFFAAIDTIAAYAIASLGSLVWWWRMHVNVHGDAANPRCPYCDETV